MATTSLKSHFETVTETKPPISVEREIGKQGLRKQILRKGTSWQTPLLGDEVQVHFSGHIDGGACLASSRDTGTPFCFKLGQASESQTYPNYILRNMGEVIKGWDEGVATMKKGERAIFFIPSVLAYGEAGSPPLIPSNSSLVFDIELLSWSTIRDITGDGGILKKIIKEGEGWATPRDNDEVLVKYEARLQNGALVSESNEGVEFRVFDGHLCPAISKAVKTMRRGEKAELAVKFSCKSVLLVPSKAVRNLYWKTDIVIICINSVFANIMNQSRVHFIFVDGIENDGYEATDIEGGVSSFSNLTIQLELLSWKSVVDVTGDQKVLKKIKKAGQGFDRPNEGSLVKDSSWTFIFTSVSLVIYIGRLEDGTVFETRGSDEEPFEFTTLEENVNEGLERAIMTMKKEEQATVTISAEYLCSHEVSELVSADSVLHYEVTLIDFTKVTYSKSSSTNSMK
ncbi:hypothetical protein CUMW_076070 [Citrus unshiu]|nr:hypothetical protein CUMW_076070 [Citrus unshiu]